MPIAWVTGASSGLGKHIFEALQQDGWQVVGGARSFQERQGGAALCLPLDVTREDSAQRFVQQAMAAFGPPDALVNAAGVLITGACEDYSDGELKQVLSVNFLGTARMVRLTLPLMRAKGQGRIVNLSSINGLLATPFQGAYTASKHAMEGYSEALSMEVAPHGIQVMIVEPGDHRGGQDKYRAHAAEAGADYAKDCAHARAAIARDEARGSDPALLGKKVARAMKKRRMPLRLQVVKLSERMAVLLHDLLPGRLFTRFLSAYYGVGRR